MSHHIHIEQEKLRFKRFDSIDFYRGFAILLMLIYNYVPLFSYGVPLVLQHGREDMLLFGDLIAPFFNFIMGVCLTISVLKRTAKGFSRRDIFRHVVKRSLYLIILGLFLDILVYKKLAFTWGVLEALGLSYLIAYFALGYPLKVKVFLMSVMLFLYSYLLSLPTFVQILIALPHGGPLGVISWAPITIIGTICGEYLLSKKEREFKYFLLKSSIILMMIGFLIHFWIPFNKKIVSTSYTIFAAGASILFFLVFYHFIEQKRFPFIYRLFEPLKIFGVSALTAWILQYIVGYYPVYYIIGHSKFLPFYFGSLLALNLIVLIWFMTKELDKHLIRLKL